MLSFQIRLYLSRVSAWFRYLGNLIHIQSFKFIYFADMSKIVCFVLFGKLNGIRFNITFFIIGFFNRNLFLCTKISGCVFNFEGVIDKAKT